MNATADLAVIIPALNEAARLPALLRSLQAQQHIRLQLLVVDGGSADASVSLAMAAGATVLHSTANRARQMNTGAGCATAQWLLFLHADSGLHHPSQLRDALALCRQAGPRVAGHFPLQFVERPNYSHRFGYRFMQEKSALNRPYCQNGDQGVLIHAQWLRQLGGWDESLPFFEDLRLAERIHAEGRWLTLPGQLQTSARRFEQEGWLARYRLMGGMVAAHGMGLEGFFSQASNLYRQHDQAEPLCLSPYLDLAAELLHNLPWRQRWQHWLRLGRFARQHWWQLWFRVDVALRPVWGAGRNPALWMYERCVHPFICNPLADGLTALLAWLYVMGWLRLTFRFREHKSRLP